ncbi:transglutaminase family protein [Faunimonas sp. B44]|uniref:transglutaminase family protein n=1 Tax=Faunimonas sp. B44 TaxID=3461493 RepID=UPI004044D8A1
MLLSIRHTTRYAYAAPGSFAVHRLRLTPAGNRMQRIVDWRLEAPGLEAAAEYTDGFGNRTHLVASAEPHSEWAVTAAGLVETEDQGGLVGMPEEAASPAVFLRSTPLTAMSAEMEAFAHGIQGATTLAKLHALLEGIAGHVAYDTDATHSGTTAAEAFERRSGVCQDHTHIFVAASRRLGIPARYVTGYLHLATEESEAAHHAWAEAWVEDLGWVGFDAANGICPTEHYVRLACGLDAPSAAPITGVRRGGGGERLDVDVVVQQQQQ